MKDTQNEIKQNIQGTNSDRKETRTQSNDLKQKEKINIHPEQSEETKLKNMKRVLQTSETRKYGTNKRRDQNSKNKTER